MEYELRTGDVGEDFSGGKVVATGESSQVFYDPKAGEVRAKPDWFTATVVKLEGRPEDAFQS